MWDRSEDVGKHLHVGIRRRQPKPGGRMRVELQPAKLFPKFTILFRLLYRTKQTLTIINPPLPHSSCYANPMSLIVEYSPPTSLEQAGYKPGDKVKTVFCGVVRQGTVVRQEGWSYMWVELDAEAK